MKRPALLVFGAWSVLALYLVAYLPAGLGIAAFVGSFDRNHQVQVRLGERSLALVLHHGRHCVGHRHGVIARALTRFAQPASATDPDHVIQFSAADSLSRKSQIALMPFPNAAQSAAALSEIVFAAPSHTTLRLGQPHPPPDESGLLRCLRSIVLLI
jgi:hypothetical protein